MKPSLYVETTIPSYLIGDISPVIATAAHQMATRRWWEERRSAYRLFVSPAVDEEAGRGDPLRSQRRQAALTGIPRLPVTDEIVRLAREIFAHPDLPESAKMDSIHLAVSSHYQSDYLLT
jgi:hypothetical protein